MSDDFEEPLRELEILMEGVEVSWEEPYTQWVYKLLADLGVSWYSTSITFCSDMYIQALNRDWRSKDEPTDVLSFEQDPQEHPQYSLHQKGFALYGDLVISLDTLSINSKYFQVREQEELKRITIHGLLHLLGWDHHTNDISEPMLVKQEMLLESYIKVDIF